MDFVIFGILILFTYFRIKSAYYSYLVRDFSIKFHELHSKMDALVSERKVKEHELGYKLLSGFFREVPKNLKHLNLYLSVFSFRNRKRDKDFVKFEKKLTKKLDKNDDLKKIFVESNILIFEYMAKKHFITVAFLMIFAITFSISEKLKKATSVQYIQPQLDY